MSHKDAIAKLIPEVLDGTELRLRVDSYTLEENLELGVAKITCTVRNEKNGERQVISGEGVGIVDAFFNGLIVRYSSQYPSLTTIRFSDFQIKANVDTGRQSARSDMAAGVTLHVVNSDGKTFAFAHGSPSLTLSSIMVVLQAVEFFINSERAFIDVYRALHHARHQNRADSIQRYTAQLTTLVEATSYSEVIEQIKKSELPK
jgi:hypothetical protein